MNIVVLSDIHANFPALKSAAESFADSDKIVSLGDIVGYGPNPIECIDWVAKNTILSIKGNHDSALCDDSELNNFNEYARQTINITRKMIPESYIDYICNLSLTASIDDFFFVHANPHDPGSWAYIVNETQIYFTLRECNKKVIFIGHSHVPFIAELANGKLNLYKKKTDLKSNGRYLVNVGSIGQPRDGDNRLSYAYFDELNNCIEIVRKEYDITETQRMMKERRLPGFLIERLEYGR